METSSVSTLSTPCFEERSDFPNPSHGVLEGLGSQAGMEVKAVKSGIKPTSVQILALGVLIGKTEPHFSPRKKRM